MTIIVNGAPRVLQDGATLAEVVALLVRNIDARGVAAARNGEVILRAAWGETRLVTHDRVEVLHAVQGG